MELAQIFERNADLRGRSPHNPYVSNKIWMVDLWVRIIGKNQKKAKKLLTDEQVFLHFVFIIIPYEKKWIHLPSQNDEEDRKRSSQL